jgi:hypothetical protein
MAFNFIKAILKEQSVFGEFPTKSVGILYLSLEDNASHLNTKYTKCSSLLTCNKSHNIIIITQRLFNGFVDSLFGYDSRI